MFTEGLIDRTVSGLNVAVGPANGPRLWLFHGVGRRWRDFAPILPALVPHWQLNAVDHRGHGLSGREARYAVPDYIRDGVGAVAAGGPAVLVGHSLGALVALGVAGRLTDTVRAVILLDPPGAGFLARIDESPYAAMWEGMRRLAGRGQVPTVARELADLRLPGPRPGETVRLGDLRDAAAVRFMARCLADLDPAVLTPPLEKRWLDGFDPLAAAAGVRCPALLVIADPARGGMLPPADADPLAVALRDCTRVDLPGVGHLVHWQDTAATVRVVLSFLGSL